MKLVNVVLIGCAVAAIYSGQTAIADELSNTLAPARQPAVPHEPLKPTVHALAQPALEELAAATTPNAGFSTKSAFAKLVPSPDSALSPPVTITYSGNSPALQINDSGTSKGVLSQITNSSNSSSALYGITNGSGAGLTGFNNGTVGPAGKFGIINSTSAQAGAFATTNGVGPAILTTITASNSQEAAVIGQNISSTGYGVGVQGQGNQYGVIGVNTTSGVGVYGSSPEGYGNWGFSASGIGVYGQTDSGHGVYGSSSSGTAVYGITDSGYAGYFVGTVYATSFSEGSDRESKTDIRPIDRAAILDKVTRLPLSSWVFKADPEKHHVGPMAQDFHAAFGLDGTDDKHINVTDALGISLAAIQELSNETTRKDREIAARLADRDAEITALKEQVRSLRDSLSARLTILERQEGRIGAVQTASLSR